MRYPDDCRAELLDVELLVQWSRPSSVVHPARRVELGRIHFLGRFPELSIHSVAPTAAPDVDSSLQLVSPVFLIPRVLG